jgi:hypothetical protein
VYGHCPETTNLKLPSMEINAGSVTTYEPRAILRHHSVAMVPTKLTFSRTKPSFQGYLHLTQIVMQAGKTLLMQLS